MKTKYGGKVVLILICMVSAGFLLGGCGSGGGSGGGSTGGAGSGSVALLLADSPVDEYESIFLCITSVSLIPSQGNPYVLFESDRPEGYCVDLLKYREKDFLFTVRDRVPAGFYNKIRLEVAEVTAVPKSGLNPVPPCGDNIKLPSGRVDLNPRGGFHVRSGQTLSIRLDIDANKSFALHQAGNSGKCIFRPVVFVDIEPVYDFNKCPDILKGEIVEVHSDTDGIVDYFILDLDGNRRNIRVELSDRTRIFDEDGNFVDRTIHELRVYQIVKVRGWLTPRGTLRSSLVVIGDVLTIAGTADGEVDKIENTFPLLIDPGQVIIDESVDVLVSDETLILADCDTIVGRDAIQQYVRTEVIGKLGGRVLRSVAVLLKSFQEVRGFLGNIRDVPGGYLLTLYDSDMQADTTPTFSIFLPDGNPVVLLGDGSVPIDLLQNLVTCKRREVIVHFDEDESQNHVAQKVVVINETARGTVLRKSNLDERKLLIEVEDGSTITVKVREGAFFYKQGEPGDDGDFRVEFGDIEIGDNLNISGLSACDDPPNPYDDVEFIGFAVVILSSTISF
jgi:hypothetical protein